MAVLMVLEVPGGTVKQYERANELMGITGDDDAPDGLVSHVAAVTEAGIVIADVWESEVALETFFEERAGAALAEAGMPEAKPHVARVHNHIRRERARSRASSSTSRSTSSARTSTTR
jgi:hypothetical protein